VAADEFLGYRDHRIDLSTLEGFGSRDGRSSTVACGRDRSRCDEESDESRESEFHVVELTLKRWIQVERSSTAQKVTQRETVEEGREGR